MPLSGFHPALRQWFAERFPQPTAPQQQGWPLIAAGRHTLIAAPTGTGKTLAAFLWAIDSLLRLGAELPDETQVVYVSPLRALGNDVQKNLRVPLDQVRALDPALPEIGVLVRSGDTTPQQRAAMRRRAPHILVTTPESLYILLTSEGGRNMLRNVRTVIVDEIHAVAGDKRGAHLALSLERLEALAGPVQRIGLSATQKPIEDMAKFLVGPGRECACVDAGHRRELDLAVEVPATPLDTVCSHEHWSEIYGRIASLIREHRTTLVFVNTRRLAERLAARLTEELGPEQVTCHHSSLSRPRRLDAEQRLKAGSLRALVATASLELGIDIGEVDLAIQIGSCRRIATLLQRVGRAGHGPWRIAAGRLFPLTIDELAEAAALLRAVRRGDLDRTLQPLAPLDVLAQQVVAACVAEAWDEGELFGLCRRAWPYRDLDRKDFDDAVALHTEGRNGLLHRDGVNQRLRGKRRARIAAVTCGGAIPDVADYQVLLEPEATLVGTINEDFAIESSAGDIFQLGNASWRILRIERGAVRVADAQGAPPTVPFWEGEAPARSDELCVEVSRLREECTGAPWLQSETGLPPSAAEQLAAFLDEGRAGLGAVPTQQRVILERFFDESGGMQLVVHAPFGRRINRAWGLALRKRFCRGFGFELQAAANEESIVISLGEHHSFALETVFDFLHPDTARDLLIQAMLPNPMFGSRWRWNATRSLAIERVQSGKRVPAPLIRMRAEDLLARAFPGAIACPETLGTPDVDIPIEHPLVRQTIEDCLVEAMNIDGFLEVLRGLRDGRIQRRAVDTTQPSAFARGILAVAPYGFLDDAPIQERRTQAVIARRGLDERGADGLGALDRAAVERVREEAWPNPANAEEVHEALLWMGYYSAGDKGDWGPWLSELEAQGRVAKEVDRWHAVEASRDPTEIWRGRLAALGPVFEVDDPALEELEHEGAILRVRIDGRAAWCDRRLLARIHRYTVERLRKEIEPVTAAEFQKFLWRWQHVEEQSRLDGPRGAAAALAQLAGLALPAALWEKILAARVRGWRREWLDELTLSGEVAWGRLWGGAAGAVRSAPISLLPRADLERWLDLGDPAGDPTLGGAAGQIRAVLAQGGAMFLQEIESRAELPESFAERGLAELITHGLATCDSFAALRQLIVPPSRRRRSLRAAGRWSLFRRAEADRREPDPEFVARQLLRRSGVVFRRTALKERQPIPWGELVRVYRRLELRGEIRGGRFVAGFAGEQFALPEAVEQLRKARREPDVPVEALPGDPADYRGVLSPPQPAHA